MGAAGERNHTADGNQLMTEGNVELVLDYCTEYWNGTEPCRLSSRVRGKTGDGSGRKEDRRLV